MTKKTHSAFVLGHFCALSGKEIWNNSQVSALTDLNEESLEISETLLEGMRLTFEQSQGGFFTWEERRDFFKRLSEKIAEKKESLAYLIHQEVLKPLSLAQLEVDRSVEVLKHTLAAMPLFENGDWIRDSLKVQRIAKGPILAITPFNFPWNLVAHKVFPALALGCPVLLKPSPKASLCALALADLCRSLGLPEGFLSVVPASPEVLRSWIADSRIAHVTFTGSAKVGWDLRQSFPQKSFTLELGGAAPVYVAADSVSPTTAETLAMSSFQYAGQVCISTQNIYIENSQFENFKSIFLKTTQNFSEELCAEALPAVENSERREKLEQAAQNKKIKLLYKRVFENSKLTPLEVYEVLDDSNKLYQEELFAPVVFLHKCADLNDWTEKVNAYPSRLQCSIFYKDIATVEKQSQKLHFGGVIVNGPTTLRFDDMPYGGEGLSGIGREGPRYAMEDYSSLQSLAFVKTT